MFGKINRKKKILQHLQNFKRDSVQSRSNQLISTSTQSKKDEVLLMLITH